mgnify:FL=1
MTVTVYLDGDPTIREEGFFASKVSTLENRLKAVEFDNAELIKVNLDLVERVKKLATKPPAWPKGYRPRRNDQKR